jgi:hypothetical protein
MYNDEKIREIFADQDKYDSDWEYSDDEASVFDSDDDDYDDLVP